MQPFLSFTIKDPKLLHPGDLSVRVDLQLHFRNLTLPFL